LRPLVSVAQGVIGLLTLLVHLWVASHASRFFVDAMRTGTIELLLATPLAPRQIVLGQLWALRETFLRPVLVLMLLNILLAVGQMEATRQALVTASSSLGSDYSHYYFMQLINVVEELTRLATGLIATAWFGMWMGLTSKKANVAVAKTIIFVQVIPFIALIFVSLILQFTISFGAGFVGFTNMQRWLPQIIILLLAVAADIAFILVSRKKLLTQFRELASGDTPVKPPEPHQPWSPEWEKPEATVPPASSPDTTPPTPR